VPGEMTAGVTQTVAVLRSWKTVSNPPANSGPRPTTFKLAHDAAGGGRGGFGGFGGGGAASRHSKQLWKFRGLCGASRGAALDGVSNGAKNLGQRKFVRDHWGSLMPFTCDITILSSRAKPRASSSELTTAGRVSRICPRRRLQRDVKFFAEPENYISRSTSRRIRRAISRCDLKVGCAWNFTA